MPFPEVVLLYASVSADAGAKGRTEELQKLFELKGLPLALLDGAYEPNRELRGRLFATSGHRATYPQVFLRTAADAYAFVGLYDALHEMNESNAVTGAFDAAFAEAAAAAAGADGGTPALRLLEVAAAPAVAAGSDATAAPAVGEPPQQPVAAAAPTAPAPSEPTPTLAAANDASGSVPAAVDTTAALATVVCPGTDGVATHISTPAEELAAPGTAPPADDPAMARAAEPTAPGVPPSASPTGAPCETDAGAVAEAGAGEVAAALSPEGAHVSAVPDGSLAQAPSLPSSSNESGAPTTTSPAPGSPAAPPVWTPQTDRHGERYYWNAATRQSSWVDPSGAVAAGAATAQPQHGGTAVWVKQLDPARGRHYWYDFSTGQSVWRLPAA